VRVEKKESEMEMEKEGGENEESIEDMWGGR
jgi:hypothetical protein